MQVLTDTCVYTMSFVLKFMMALPTRFLSLVSITGVVRLCLGHLLVSLTNTRSMLMDPRPCMGETISTGPNQPHPVLMWPHTFDSSCKFVSGLGGCTTDMSCVLAILPSAVSNALSITR